MIICNVFGDDEKLRGNLDYNYRSYVYSGIHIKKRILWGSYGVTDSLFTIYRLNGLKYYLI